jgi:hypothetical protein
MEFSNNSLESDSNIGEDTPNESQQTFQDDDEDNAALLHDTNNLLFAVGIPTKKISTISELSRVASSMFVAVYESIFHVRLDNIIRTPENKEDYSRNAQCVINGLSLKIKMNLEHISGYAIVHGDVRALTDLVNIFVRYVSFISIGGDASETDSRSLSTTESMKEEERKKNRKKMNTYKSNLRNNPRMKDIKKLVAQDARQVLYNAEKRLKQDEKIEFARKRRELLKKTKEAELSAGNKRRAEISERAMQKRWMKETEREDESFKLRRSSEEHVMLRKIYRGLIHKMHEWKVIEHEEVRDKVNTMREEAREHIKSLQALFEDRIKVLKEKEIEILKDSEIEHNATKSMGTSLKHTFIGQKEKVLKEQKTNLNQRRQQQLLKRRESHFNLLSLLSAEKWEKLLREN